MIVHLVASVSFWLNYFPPSKPGAGMSNTKDPRQLVPGTFMDYKNFSRIYTSKYFQVHQYDEPRNTIDIDLTVGEIVIVPQ